MVNWKASDASQRLLAAVFATHAIKVNTNSVALAYGRGATSRAIDHQIAHVREMAKALNEEVEASGLDKPPRGTEQDAAVSTPKTPRATAAAGSGTGTGKGKRKHNANQDTVERLTNPIRGSQVKAEPDDGIMDLQETPSKKRTRKLAQRPDMVANEGSGTDETEEMPYSSEDPEFAPEYSALINNGDYADEA